MKRIVLVVSAVLTAAGFLIKPIASQTQGAASQLNSNQARRPTLDQPWARLHPAAPPYRPTNDEKAQIQAKLDELDGKIRELQAKGVNPELLADVEIYSEAARWKLTFPDEFFKPKSVGDTLTVLGQGIERADLLKRGNSPWLTQKGRVVRGFRSALDGSVQPVRVTVPDNYDGAQPVPLDVAMHGRFTSLYEVETLRSWDGAEVDYLPGTLQIDLFGRGKNTYHWPGEADVFEAINFAKRAYKIDCERMTLRGFSMGGAGVWHTSLHFPDLWAAVEVGAGDNTSLRIPVLSTLPSYQQPMCKIFDNMYEWAINAYDIPFASYVGENDRSLVKHNSAKEQLIKAGIQFEGDPFSLKAVNAPSMIFLIAPKTGHDMHPESRKTLNEYLYERLKMGRQTPNHIRFATYTARYNRAYWITVDGLLKHYDRAEVDATRSNDLSDYNITTRNVSRLLINQTDHLSTLHIDGQEVKAKPGPQIALENLDGHWKIAATLSGKVLRKKHGLQGPIDDAFLEPFLVVRPTGVPWNAAANDQALRILRRFERQYSIVYRGHVRFKDDNDVTNDDIARYHLILFGDPGSNRLIHKVQKRLPVRWTKEKVSFGSKRFLSADTLPALIYPNPLNSSHYVVINSGLTADWIDWAGDFPTPRYGDFAVFAINSSSDDPHAVYAGLFNESWQLP
jgi:hypothetical protein